MIWNIVIALGGVGLFLLGITMLTEGLRRLSGDRLRRILAERTRTPLRGAIVGALSTAIVQSSSATTVTVVGFVGAGLLTFAQGLGVVFGANIGTTITGWMVAVIGFKLKIGDLALPLVFAGAVLRLFAHGKLRESGWALAGFGLLFVGIETMQSGMAAFEGVVTPEQFPDDTWTGRLVLILIGMLITVITQSSSAGVAASLVALGTGAISFPQAAALVVGMDVGTTFTTALSTIGGSTAMRRTGYAHVVYNLMTGVMAFLLLGPYTALATSVVDIAVPGNAQLSLVAFHTLFNALGVILVIPFATRFAELIERLVPERRTHLTGRLDQRLLSEAPAAVDAAAATLRDITRVQYADLRRAVVPREHASHAHHASVAAALEATRDFVGMIRTRADEPAVNARHEAILHALDHARRLAHRLLQSHRVGALPTDRRLRRLSQLVDDAALRMLAPEESPGTEAWLEKLSGIMGRAQERYRRHLIDAAAEQRIDAEDTLKRIDAVRWLHRVVYHLWRMHYHLRRAEVASTERTGPDSIAIQADEN